MKYIRKISGINQFPIPTPNLVLNESSGELSINYECPLYIEALEDLTFKLSHSGSNNDNHLSYSYDGIEWSSIAINEESPVIKAGEVVFIKGNKLNCYRNSGNYTPGIGTFVVTGKYNLGGNIKSLEADKSGVIGDYSYPKFFALFSGNNNLIDASSLVLEDTTDHGCYSYMFNECKNLLYPPKLPATKVAKRAYENMFNSCENLIKAPALPIETVGYSGCYRMFFNCKSLKYAPELPAINVDSECYEDMFYNCINLVRTPSILPADVGNNCESCYKGMFERCQSIKEGPKLPSKSVDKKAYYKMFAGCTSLTKMIELPATDIKEGCYRQMFDNCINLEGTVILPSTTVGDNCYYEMFKTCFKITEAILPATTLTSNSYYHMFYACSNLNKVTMLATDLTGDWSDWMYSVSNSGLFVKNVDANWTVESNPNVVPSGWEVINSGVYIQHVDGTLYTVDEWTSNNLDNNLSNGVAVLDRSSFVISKNRIFHRYGSMTAYSEINVPNVFTTDVKEKALLDYGGYNNTKAYLTYLGDSDSAVYVSASYQFPNGNYGYLPSLGEAMLIHKYIDTINLALTTIGGETIYDSEIITSTQGSSNYFWMINLYDGNIIYATKNSIGSSIMSITSL